MMRIVVPILALLLGVVIALSFALRNPPPPPEPAAPAAIEQPAEPDTPPQPADAGPQAAPGPEAPAPPPRLADAPTATADVEYTAIPGLHVTSPPEARDAPSLIVLGSDDPASPYMMRVDLVKYGAGYKRIVLSRYSERADADDRYVIAPPLLRPGSEQPWRYPLAAHWITVNGSPPIILADKPWALTEHSAQAAQYELTLADERGAPVLRIVRRYELPPDSYDLQLAQRLENLTDRPLRVTLRQWLQGDIFLTVGDYMGDQRKIVTGYYNPTYDETTVFVKNAFRLRQKVMDAGDVWPHDGVDADKRLAWLAAENRYFALIVHPRVPPGATSAAQLPYFDQQFERFGIDAEGERLGVLAAQTPPLTLAPGDAADVDVALFAGPREAELFKTPPYRMLGFRALIRYELGCTWCTFQWLAHFLLWFLETIHVVVADWGVAIIVLVLVVRLLLHPITKKAQINMMKMGKQMQMLQPEMDKIKKKYKDDPSRMNQEVMKLYREKGVNPMGMVGGCLPMLLQMPIWVALYAMLYFAIELRQQPAFYGVFQLVSAGNWHFLQDLSQPDNFIRFVPMGRQGLAIPFPFIDLHISGLNILPLLMAVVFYFQQKFTTPPPANEQAAQQQKMMKWMVLLFPVMLYSAPSGLTLYILASTAAGILDSYMVRKHIREQEEAGTLFDRKPRKPGGLMDRLARKMEEKQREMQKLQQQRGGGGKKRGRK